MDRRPLRVRLQARKVETLHAAQVGCDLSRLGEDGVGRLRAIEITQRLVGLALSQVSRDQSEVGLIFVVARRRGRCGFELAEALACIAGSKADLG